jgi:hypothetical protein
LLHIKSCARKRALTNETVRILILQEIQKEAFPDIPATGKKEKGVEASKTMMADLMDSAVPRKRSKRPEVIPSIRTIIDTRESILQRARAVFDNIDSPSDAFENPTQVFQPSKLAGTLSKRRESPLDRDRDRSNPPTPGPSDSRTDTFFHRAITATPITVRNFSPTEIASD